MKRILCIVFFCSLTLRSLIGQTQTYSLSLYYEINEIKSDKNFTRLDSLLRSVGTAQKQISLSAYADFLANPEYNQVLSQLRLDAVKNYLRQKEGKNLRFNETKAFGETYSQDNSSALGEPSQRRVDVRIEIQLERKKIAKGPLETQANSEKPIKRTQRTHEEKKEITDLHKGESLAIEGLSFIPGRHVLMKSSLPVLEELLNTLKENPNLKIEVQGHICCLSESEADGLDLDTGELKLSENRALAVYNYLVKNGIDEERLNYKGYGHRFPKVNEQSPEDEQINRRVEIKILEN